MKASSLEWSPDIIAGLTSIAASLFSAGFYREAETIFEGLVEVRPHDPLAAWGLAISKYRREDWAGADAALERITRLAPEHSATKSLRAVCRMYLGDEAGARAMLPPPHGGAGRTAQPLMGKGPSSDRRH